jgi:drug/metabolite transporter (DMT)-like permease
VTAAALALVMAAATMHAGWNAMAKRGHDQVVFLWWASCVATVGLLPIGIWYLAGAGISAGAAPFVAVTIALHTVYFYTLGRSYGSGAFSIVYPMARGLGVALVPVVALVVFDEQLSPLGTAGIALVVLGVVALHLVPGARAAAGASGAPAVRRIGPATGWATLTGLVITAYSLVDKAGVSRLNPVPYMMLLEGGCVLVLWPIVRARGAAWRHEWQTHWREIVVAGVMSAAAYTLVLFAFRLSKAGYVVAAREMSIVISAIIGSVWLREGTLAPRLAGATIVLAGVACIALAR